MPSCPSPGALPAPNTMSTSFAHVETRSRPMCLPSPSSVIAVLQDHAHNILHQTQVAELPANSTPSHACKHSSRRGLTADWPTLRSVTTTALVRSDDIATEPRNSPMTSARGDTRAPRARDL